MTTIPASTIVSVLPGVLAAGGSSLDLNGLFLSNSSRIPTATVIEFATSDAVIDFFGATSNEAVQAASYFAGFDDSTVKPGNLLMAQFNTAAVSASLHGGNVASALTLTQLKAITGTLTIAIDGTPKTGTINLSGATSFSNAASLIAQTLDIEGAVVAQCTGSISGTVFTAASGLTGAFAPGQFLSGAGVTPGTLIVSQSTGPTGGIGTYVVSVSQTVGSVAITSRQAGVSFDSVSGGFVAVSSTTGISSSISFASGAAATPLFLGGPEVGAYTSQGAAIAVPDSFMTNIATNYRNWASFTPIFNPDQNGNDIRLAFAQWNSQQNGRYACVLVDADSTPRLSSSAPASLGARVEALGYAGNSVNWQLFDPGANGVANGTIGAFVCGAIASINFDQTNGRITFNGRQQSGLTPSVTDQTSATNLKSNGYNFYAAIGTANQNFTWYEDGSVSGPFTWLDSLVNSIWLTNAFQLALMILLQNTFSIPYNSTGKAMIEQALSDTIQQGLAFGAYRVGVTLSGSQKAAVNAAAGGLDIAATLTIQGWYLLVGDASPTVRQARGSPPCTFFYMDGEAVQKINLSAIVLL